MRALKFHRIVAFVSKVVYPAVPNFPVGIAAWYIMFEQGRDVEMIRKFEMGNMCRRVRTGGLLPTLRTAHTCC